MAKKFFGTSIQGGPAESHNKCDVSRPPDPFRFAWSQEINTFSSEDGRVSAVPAVLQVTGYILLCCNLCEMKMAAWRHVKLSFSFGMMTICKE